MFIIFRQKDDSAIIINPNLIAYIKETKLNGNLLIYLIDNQSFEVKETIRDLKYMSPFEKLFE